MKQLFFALLLVCAVACSSPVEKYIENDFAHVVRHDNLDNEIKNEIKRITDSLTNLSNSLYPEIKEYSTLKAQADRMEKDLRNRVANFNRTRNYKYIVNIGPDNDRYMAVRAKANKASSKAKPYTNHQYKQLKALKAALSKVDAKTLLDTPELTKNATMTMEYILVNLVGAPNNLAKPTDEDIKIFAEELIKTHLVDNPTPAIKAYNFQKDKGIWYVSLTDGTQYFLSAIKCENGSYEYQYKVTDNPFSVE